MKSSSLISLAAAAALLITPVSAETAQDITYDGSGMCIAVIANGFTLTHETLTLTGAPAITKDAVDALLPELTAEGECWVSDKIPFAYDYAGRDNDVSGGSQGTALMSLAAGNPVVADDTRTGVAGAAPGAQLFAMKVAADGTSLITESAVTAAIGDAVLLGADVILLGFTNPCGFGADEAAELDAAILAAHEAGIHVVGAAGDIIEYGTDSFYDASYSMTRPISDVPDVGTIGFPGSIAEVFTVGSADANTVTADSIVLADGTVLPYSDSNDTFPTITGGKTFAAHFAGQSFEYIYTDTLGRPEELLACGNLTGKFVTITRGTLPFAEKAMNAAALGAAGVIVVDNTPDPNAALQTLMDLTDSPIPAILVSSSAADALKSAADKRFTIGAPVTVELRATPAPSDFSSMGTTPEMLLKPDLITYGSAVRCASASGGYTTMSSTLASAASAAGMLACVRQKLDAALPGLSAAERAAMAENLLISSAELSLAASGSAPFSPRLQGGGTADVSAALSAELLLTSDGRASVSLGDGHMRYLRFPVTAHNLSDEAKALTLSALVGTDSVDTFTYSQLDIPDEKGTKLPSERLGKLPEDTVTFIGSFTPFDRTRISIGTLVGQLNERAEGFAPYRFTVPAGGSRTIMLTVLLHQEEYEACCALFENGFFVEGFVKLTDGTETASIPFVGFSGNYYQASPFEPDLYSGIHAFYEGRWLSRAFGGSGTKQISPILGSDAFARITEDTVYDGAALYFSPKADRNSARLRLHAGLRRSVTDAQLTVTDEAGEVIVSRSLGKLARTYISARTGMPVSAELDVWDGRAADNPLYFYPDGRYTITFYCRLAEGEAQHSFSYDIILDTKAPVITDPLITEAEGKHRLTASITDDNALARILVTDSRGLEADAAEDGSFHIDGLTGDYLYIEAWDAALNRTILRMANPLAAAE